MKLYLEKRGCDFRADDAAKTISDLGNYRLYLEFIDREGKRVRGDVQRGCVRDGKRVTCEDGLYTHLCYESHSGCFGYRIPMQDSERLRYTKADVLRLVNSVSAVGYEDVEIVDELPAAAHEYPEAALALERGYLAREHAALYAEAAEIIRGSYIAWCGRLDWSLRQMSADEYKRLALLAFEGLRDHRASLPQSRGIGMLAAREMAHYLFEVQQVINLADDPAFIRDVYALCPDGVSAYIRDVTPEELAALCARNAAQGV